MSNDTEDNFWIAFNSQPDIEPPKIFYRLYYNKLGHPLFYSMEDLPGNYIEIDKDTYHQSARNIRIVNGAIKQIFTSATSKLVPANYGTCCSPDDVCIVVDSAESFIKWGKKNYEPD
jgi:hypothetical protein